MSDSIGGSRWKTILTVVTLIALGILMYAVRDELANTFRDLQRVNVLILTLIVPLQVVNYHAQAKLYQASFWLVGERLRYRSLYRLSLELNFVNNLFPSASVSGFSYFALRLKSGAKVPGSKSTLVLLMRFILLFVSFQILLATGVLLLALDGQASGLVILVASSLTTLLIIMTAGLAFVIGSKRRINGFFTALTKILNKAIHKLRPHRPETISIASVQETFTDLHENYQHIKRHWRALGRPLGYSLLANVTEIACLYVVYVAFGNWVNPGAVILAFAVANFAGFFSVLPGAIGMYEALMTAVLVAAGVPAGVSLPATVMYRVLTMAVQLPPGGYLYHRALNDKPILAQKNRGTA